MTRKEMSFPATEHNPNRQSDTLRPTVGIVGEEILQQLFWRWDMSKTSWKDIPLASAYANEGDKTIRYDADRSNNDFFTAMWEYRHHQSMNGFYPMDVESYIESEDPESGGYGHDEIDWTGFDEAYAEEMSEDAE